jgi:hypothetical protein
MGISKALEVSERTWWELATPLQEARSDLYESSGHSAERYELIEREKLDRNLIEAHAGCVCVCPIKFFPDGTFEFHANGKLGGVIEVFDFDDETTIDLVAWSLDDPTKFATAQAYAPGLGLARVRNPATYFGRRPLFVFRTPMAWLKSGCQGVVILREASAYLWLSAALGNIAAEDLQHAQQLARLLEGFFDPARILVPSGPVVSTHVRTASDTRLATVS